MSSTPPLRLTPPDEALATLLAMLAPCPPRRVPVAEAVGLVLAVPLVVPGPLPIRPVALVAGWAVRAEETLGAGPYAPAPLATLPVPVAPGDALPDRTDAVLGPFELEEGPLPQALQGVVPGEGVRAPGEDAAPGTRLREAGERMTARDLPALAAMGVAEVPVRIPRIAWAGAAAPFVSALIRGEAGESCALADCTGREDTPPDLILVTGPGSGFVPTLHGLGSRPGGPAAIGLVGAVPAVLLPGLPQDAYAAWILLLRPALRHLTGAPPLETGRARLARKVASTVGLAEIVPLRLDGERAEPLAVGAVPLSALAAADGVLVVPPGAEGYEAGAEISVLPP
jgi:molybdopterin biosynthesis enzyme